MKSYEERLPLIDAAIDELGGKWPNSDYDIESYLVKLDTGTYVLTAGLVSDPRCNICNRTQFEKRAKELGYINGYEYGVEYKNNGEKPDLPDDVLIQQFHNGAWVGELSRGAPIAKPVSDWMMWSDVTKFRIVDERYKPKEQDMNDNWNGNGDPEIGHRLMYLGGNKEREAIVLGVHKDESDDTVIWHKPVDGLYGGGKCFSVDSLCFFRPLRTEADKLVDEAMSLFSQTETTSDAKQGIEHAVHKLIEQGYRKIKPMSEQEFMKQCVDICGHGDARLYRAGCRFIEQVKV